MKINASIVVYKTPFADLQQALEGLMSSRYIANVYIVDNSPENVLEKQFQQAPYLDRVVYIYNQANLGYGKAHNKAIRYSMASADISYHIVVNPDIFVKADAIEGLMQLMEQHADIGLVMPKILYMDGSLQYLCKKLPTPFDLLLRRFLPGPIKKMLQQKLDSYELRHRDYNQQMDVPNLSGCFMFLRVDAIKKAGLFDERYFMYLEDTDLSRRIHAVARTVYYPQVEVFHGYEKGSYKNPKLLIYHIQSAFSYFFKWGWLFDAERRRVNRNL